MAAVKIRSFNARRAQLFGYKLSVAEKVVLFRSLLHSHTELQFSDRYGSLSFSATTAEGANCCRFKQIHYSHPEYWDTLIVDLTDAEEDAVYAAAKQIEGQPYDTIGLFSFTSDLEIIKPREGYWWCTECVLHCLFSVERIRVMIPLVPDESHPTLCDMICRMFFENDTVSGDLDIALIIGRFQKKTGEKKHVKG